MGNDLSFGVPFQDLNSSSFYNPDLLAGINTNYSSFLPVPAINQNPYQLSGFDLSSIPEKDRWLPQLVSMQLAESRYQSDPQRYVDALNVLEPIFEKRAEKQQKLGLQSNLWTAAIKTLADLPKTIAQSAAQVREGRLAGQQAILNQQQRPYNIASMPYNSYRI